MTATYRLPPGRPRADRPGAARDEIVVWGGTGIDYANLERKIASRLGIGWQYERPLSPLRPWDWIIWRTNGRKLVGQIKSRRSSHDYEVYLLNPENYTHIVIVQMGEIVKIRPNHLEILAATA